MKEDIHTESTLDYYEDSGSVTKADLNIADRAIDEALSILERLKDSIEEDPTLEEKLGENTYEDILAFMDKYSND